MTRPWAVRLPPCQGWAKPRPSGPTLDRGGRAASLSYKPPPSEHAKLGLGTAIDGKLE